MEKIFARVGASDFELHVVETVTGGHFTDIHILLQFSAYEYTLPGNIWKKNHFIKNRVVLYEYL